MKKLIKSVCDLTIDDLRKYPVWEYIYDEAEWDETAASPVTRLPVSTLDDRVVGAQVTLSNGMQIWASMSNITLDNYQKTAKYITISIFSGDKRFDWARNFDADYERHGPIALASFLGLPLEEVFPMSYDLSNIARGVPEVVKGVICPY